MPLIHTAPLAPFSERYLVRVAAVDDAARMFGDDAGDVRPDRLQYSTAADGTMKSELMYTDSEVENIVRRACEKILLREREAMLALLETRLAAMSAKREAATDYTEEAYIFGGAAAEMQETITEFKNRMEGNKDGESEF